MFDIGDILFASWTNCHNLYITKVKIVKENKKTWITEILNPIYEDENEKESYLVGQKIKIPKEDNIRGYSKWNRLIHPSEIEKAIDEARKRNIDFYLGSYIYNDEWSSYERF